MRRLTLLLLVAALAAPAGAQAARPLTTGFYDSAFSEDTVWLQRATDVGAGMLRVHFKWADVAPATRPAGFDPRNPADPAYDWETTDRLVRQTTEGGMAVLLSFSLAPRWAEGPRRPRSAGAGTWLPDPAAVGDFGAALARRYSGTFADPADAARTLPRVRAFQLWNEQNLDIYLAPQWRKVRGRYRAVAPHHYRQMLKAFRTGVRANAPGSLVASGGTAPYGDPDPGGARMQPVRFVRELFCVNATLRRRTCSGKVGLDVLAHHPYSVGRPRRRALNRDDASIPDLGKLSRVVRAARRLGRVSGSSPRLWVTEVSYDSSPPDPDGIPVARHARYAEETLYLLWKARVSVVIWLTIRDSPPNPSYDSTLQAGPFYLDGRRKPAATAFRFPFVTERTSRSRVRAWGRAPVAGRVVIERRSGSGWKRVTSFRAGRRATFLRSLGLRSRATLRARVAGETSLAWTQR
jgi:hypothetical protein